MLSLRPGTLHGQRGQTLIEWAVFMPFLILTMLALIFFSRLGVLSERSQSAVRYGEQVSFKNGNPYTLATVNSVIDEILHTNSSELGPLCLEPNGPMPSTGPTVAPISTAGSLVTIGVGATVTSNASPTTQSTSIANRVAADTQAALIQAQVPSDATPVPVNMTAAPITTAKPFWKPDHILTSNCNPASIALQQGSFGAGNLPASVQSVSVSSSLNIPSYLSFLMNGETSAKMGFINIATPNTLLACVPGLSIALAVLNPATSGQPGLACNALPNTALPNGS